MTLPRIFFILTLAGFLNSVFAEPLEISFWHSMAGHLGEEVEKIVSGFNASQKKFRIKPVYKGDYLETLTGFAAAFRAGQPPAMIQIFEVGTRAMLAPKGVIKPIDELMLHQPVQLPKSSFFSAAREYYTVNGVLMAMPFNLSVPVIFYNQDALAAVGYDEKNFPKTWQEFEILAAKLHKAGHQCVYTTGHPAWILMESFSAIHGLGMFAENGNQAVYDNPPVLHHLERLLEWQKKQYFEYGGRSDDATVLFTSGRCPLYSQSSGGYNSFVAMASFRIGVASLPYDADISPKRFNNVTGGAAIWVVSGLPDKVYEGIAEFFIYFSRPEVQLQWHLNTGYLPLGTKGAYQKLPALSAHPTLVLAQKELTENTDEAVRGLTGIHNQIRQINDEELESMFSGIKSPAKALHDAVSRANHALIRFKRNTQ